MNTLKATLVVCLFVFVGVLPSWGQGTDLVLTPQLLNAYHEALDLRPLTAEQELADESTVEAAYIASLGEAIELLITEDPSKFSTYEDRFLKRIDKNIKGSPRDYQFLQAEIRLQWAFVYLKFGHELDAALRLRQAFLIAETCKEKFPEYLPIRKTAGLLNVIVGSIPEKYNWVLSLLSMNGSLATGIADLDRVADSKSPLATEARILQALVTGFINARPAEALTDMRQVASGEHAKRLGLFLSAALAMKSAQSELALQILDQLSSDDTGIPLHYANYLRGEAYLNKGDYLNAITSFRSFVNYQPGQNYIKDAYYKMGLCYWLNGNENDALELFNQARNKGTDATEADKSAARALSDKEPINPKLAKIRYATDGGYYAEAEKVLKTITSMDLTTRKDQTEYYYRKARLAHKQHQPEAEEYYLETIKMTGQDNWYFAPNACLQLGYIYRSQGRVKDAEEYFQRALSYRRHPYKNSIDSKARSALAQLTRI